MYRADTLAIAAGTPGLVLMENAGRAVAQAVMRRHDRAPVVVLCGPGNNGGDGFVAARHLAQAGWPVRLGLLGQKAKLTGDAAVMADRWPGDVEPLKPELVDEAAIVVDALFGAGLTRPLDGVAKAAVQRVNARRPPTVAVDVPSGLHGDTGRPRLSDEEPAGIRDPRRSRIGHERDRLPLAELPQQLWPPRELIVLVVADGRRVDVEVGQQRPRPPRILARDDVDLAEHAQRPRADVLQIPDRRRDHVEHPAHRR